MPGPPDPPLAVLLRQGIAAARSDRRDQARTLLLAVVERDPEALSAWLWLSGVVDTREERRICLENVLTLDPTHALAQKGLAQLAAMPAAPPNAPRRRRRPKSATRAKAASTMFGRGPHLSAPIAPP